MGWFRHKEPEQPQQPQDSIGRHIVADYIASNRDVYDYTLKNVANSATWKLHLKPLLCDLIGKAVDRAMTAPEESVAAVNQGMYIAMCDLIKAVDSSTAYYKQDEEEE